MHGHQAHNGGRIAAAAMLLLTFLVVLGAWPYEAPDATRTEPVLQAEPIRNISEGQAYRVLDRDTGLALVVLEHTSLTVVELDTASRRSFPLPAPVTPSVQSSGSTMIMPHSEGIVVVAEERLWAIDLDGGAAEIIGAGTALAPSADPGFWVLEGTGDRWVEVEGTQQGRTLTPLPNAVSLPGGSPELVTRSDGGLYRFGEDSSWRRIHDATPIAVSAATAIVRHCDTTTACSYRWIGLETGRMLDRPLPPGFDAARSYRISPSGTIVLEATVAADPPAVYVHGNGFVRHTPCLDVSVIAWSPNEDLVACIDREGVAVTDVTHGPTARFTEWRSPPLGVALVATTLAAGRTP